MRTHFRPTYNPFHSIAISLMVMCAMFIMPGCDDQNNDHPVIETGTVTDIDGNTYKTIKIGSQWWMAENLKVTSFRSGESINFIEDKEQWRTTTQAAYCVYNNLSGPGMLYNYFVIMSPEQIAPEGWRVPTDEDWKLLEEYIGMPSDLLDQTNWRGEGVGDYLKEENTTTSGWINWPGVWGTDQFGFNATGGSCRVFNGEWGVPGLRHSGYWWTSTSSNGYGWYRYLDYKKSGIFRYNAEPTYGFSIRCVKN